MTKYVICSESKLKNNIGNTSKLYKSSDFLNTKSHRWGSNPRPDVYETPALPTELRWQRQNYTISIHPVKRITNPAWFLLSSSLMGYPRSANQRLCQLRIKLICSMVSGLLTRNLVSPSRSSMIFVNAWLPVMPCSTR